MIKELENSEMTIVSGGSNECECSCSATNYLLPAFIHICSVASGTASFVAAILSFYPEDRFPAEIQRNRIRFSSLSVGILALVAELIIPTVV